MKANDEKLNAKQRVYQPIVIGTVFLGMSRKMVSQKEIKMAKCVRLASCPNQKKVFIVVGGGSSKHV